MSDIVEFNQDAIDFILSRAGFTSRERQLFLLRHDENSLEECAEIMNCSTSTVSRINKKMKKKIMSIL